MFWGIGDLCGEPPLGGRLITDLNGDKGTREGEGHTLHSSGNVVFLSTFALLLLQFSLS